MSEFITWSGWNFVAAVSGVAILIKTFWPCQHDWNEDERTPWRSKRNAPVGSGVHEKLVCVKCHTRLNNPDAIPEGEES